jgi:hypothetical protein
MGRLGLQFRRRVPLYVGLPIVVACGATGYLASMTVLPRATVSQAQTHRIPKPVAPQSEEPSNAMDPSTIASSIALPTSEVDLPTPVPILGRKEAVPENIPDATAPIPAPNALPEQRRASHAVRSASKTRRPHRPARQTKIAPATASNALQGVPLLGVMFSLMQ